MTAREGELRRLFAVELAQPAVAPLPDSWPGPGMAGSDTLDVNLDGVWAVSVGDPGAYVERPGFHHGGIGVAACWHGGARAVARTLLSASRRWDLDPHALAHVGAVDKDGTAHLRTLRVRAAVENAAGDVGTQRHRGRRLRTHRVPRPPSRHPARLRAHRRLPHP